MATPLTYSLAGPRLRLARCELIHAASLRADERLARQSGPDKPKTTEVGPSMVFTDPREGLADGMVADDQCATDER